MTFKNFNDIVFKTISFATHIIMPNILVIALSFSLDNSYERRSRMEHLTFSSSSNLIHKFIFFSHISFREYFSSLVIELNNKLKTF